MTSAGGSDGSESEEPDEIARALADPAQLTAMLADLGVVIPAGPAHRVSLGPAVPGGRTVTVEMGDNRANPGYATTGDTITTLETTGFAGCYSVILLGPGTTRTLAHINSSHFPVLSVAWDHLDAFRKLAANAHTAHIYHWMHS